MKRSIEEALAEALERIGRDDFVRAILSGSRRGKKPEFTRVNFRPVEIKNEVLIQSIAHDGKKDFTKNLNPNSPEISTILESGFANIIVDSTSESFQIQITKKEEAITGVSKTKLERVLNHDRSKERLLAEDHPIFLALGLSDQSGRIKPSARDKYIQIDQLLRILEPTLHALTGVSPIKLVDLASGSSALTLAVHTYLTNTRSVETVGVERNSDLVTKSIEMAARAGLQGIQFKASDISSATREGVDIVLALHACDTATDDAIDYVIKSKSKIALIVPCCHQTRTDEVMSLTKAIPLFAKDGIIDERLLDLTTDALRGERLRAAGYSVDIVEFVPDEHTARNLLIRAVRS